MKLGVELTSNCIFGEIIEPFEYIRHLKSIFFSKMKAEVCMRYTLCLAYVCVPPSQYRLLWGKLT